MIPAQIEISVDFAESERDCLEKSIEILQQFINSYKTHCYSFRGVENA